jgi:hypothetical protein
MAAERHCQPPDGAVADTGGAAMRDYDSRHCLICQQPRPPFGFGPPMTRRSVWACNEHRVEADRRLGPSHSASPESGTTIRDRENQGG